MPPKKAPGVPLNNALLALTASALAIPGMGRAQSLAEDAMPAAQRDSTLLDYRFSDYREATSRAARPPTARTASATTWTRTSSALPASSARAPMSAPT